VIVKRNIEAALVQVHSDGPPDSPRPSGDQRYFVATCFHTLRQLVVRNKHLLRLELHLIKAMESLPLFMGMAAASLLGCIDGVSRKALLGLAPG
jgi:hypothetical protein